MKNIIINLSIINDHVSFNKLLRKKLDIDEIHYFINDYYNTVVDLKENEHPIRIFDSFKKYSTHISRNQLSIMEDSDYFKYKYNLMGILARWTKTYNIAEDNVSLDTKANKILHYWNDFLIENKILFFSTVFPHTPHDYAIYLLTKLLGIKSVIFIPYYDPYTFEFRHLFSNDLLWKNKIYKKLLPIQSQKKETFAPLIYSNHKKPKIFITLLNAYKNPIFLLIRASRIFGKLSSLLKDKILLNYKNKLEKDSIKEFKYVFFPLHFQPEATSLPFGNQYRDQLEIVRILASLIPEDFKIVVKEHPAYHKRKFWKAGPNYSPMHLIRNREFYNEINSYQNVILISSQYDQNSLINYSSGIITITGTVVIEGSLRSKPILLFGEHFFGQLPNVFIYDNDGMKEFILCLKNKTLPYSLKEIIHTFNLMNENSILDQNLIPCNPNITFEYSKIIELFKLHI